jgi:S-DNA-T family DNA segregation ATPase FtsK/SpoIIIE
MTIQTDMNGVLSNLGIDGSCVRASRHRHLAVYDIKLACKPAVLGKLQRSAQQIALAIRSETVPIIRLVPSESIVRLQVALEKAQPVSFRSLCGGETIPDSMVFPMLLGESDEGCKLWIDMNDNPHLLIAGSTGSGKSTILHALIANGLMLHAMKVRNIWIYLSDPKRIEFQEYNKPELQGVIPHIASSYTDTLTQLEGLAELMEDRYVMMSQLGMRSVAEDPQKFPLVMCIIDEVADLMIQDRGRKLETLLVKLAQKGRASGLFMVLATQRPSVDVITGLIKANFPGRIACKTSSRKDSEVILDRGGAESLLGRGDAVIQNMRLSSVRFQAAYTTPLLNIDLFVMLRKLNA